MLLVYGLGVIYFYYCVNFACEDYTKGEGDLHSHIQIHNHWLLIKFLKVSIEVTSMI